MQSAVCNISSFSLGEITYEKTNDNVSVWCFSLIEVFNKTIAEPLLQGKKERR